MEHSKKENAQRQAVILFADDDTLCLNVGTKMLQKLGYTVLDARDGQEALEVFKNNQHEVDLVILDMKMPHNGGTTFDQLKKINAEVKVLIVSGYTENGLMREMLKQGCHGFIQKPFSLNILSQKIKEALASCTSLP